MTIFSTQTTIETPTHRYDAETAILWVTAPRVFVLSGIEPLMIYLSEATEHGMDVDTIWDLNQVDFGAVTRPMIEALVARRSGIPERLDARIVLVAKSDLAFGMSRMYQTMSEAKGVVPPNKIFVARTSQEAVDWLIHQRDTA